MKYQDEWGNTYETLTQAKAGILKHFTPKDIADELFYHITIDDVLEWCVGNADFHIRFATEMENTLNALCEDYIFEEDEEE